MTKANNFLSGDKAQLANDLLPSHRSVFACRCDELKWEVTEYTPWRTSKTNSDADSRSSRPSSPAFGRLSEHWSIQYGLLLSTRTGHPIPPFIMGSKRSVELERKTHVKRLYYLGLFLTRVANALHPEYWWRYVVENRSWAEKNQYRS